MINMFMFNVSGFHKSVFIFSPFKKKKKRKTKNGEPTDYVIDNNFK